MFGATGSEHIPEPEIIPGFQIERVASVYAELTSDTARYSIIKLVFHRHSILIDHSVGETFHGTNVSIIEI